MVLSIFLKIAINKFELFLLFYKEKYLKLNKFKKKLIKRLK